MEAYRKLIAAVIGLAVILAYRHLGLDLSAQEAVLIDVVIAGLTAAGVWGVRNVSPTPTP